MARIRVPLAAACLAMLSAGCGSDGGSDQPRLIAVFAAFPAELGPLLEHTAVEEAVVVNGRRFRVGTLGGVPVVVGLTGIGLVNAAQTSAAVFERFAVTGAVFSGVAGSPQRIADVVVPETWSEPNGIDYRAHPAWLRIAARVAASGSAALARCTLVPSASDEPVCMAHQPMLVVGGRGESNDTFAGTAFPCTPGGGPVFGCDVEPTTTALRALHERATSDERRATGIIGIEPPVAVDMETAAVAREAARRGLPFIAFRGVSDGESDPLGLPGFPAQFFAYYPIAADNAAAATAAFLDALPHR